jgi:hypothetical protein
LNGGPGLLAPLGNGRFGALAGSARRLLRTPANGLAQATDLTRMIRHAERRLTHRRNPAPAPELPSEAIGFGATLEEAGQLRELFGS